MKNKPKKQFKEVFGKNPWDPWSIKHGIAEGSGLNDFLKSRGMNPKTMDREKKSAWARSDAFKDWARNRPVSSSTYQYKTASEETELEEKVLDKPTLTPEQIAKKHNVPLDYIKQQLKVGISVEKEHTSNPSVAREIALDHLGEKPDYYKKLKKYVEEVQKPTGKLKDACWSGYTAVGMKNKGGRKVPNCVPEQTTRELHGINVHKNISDLKNRVHVYKKQPSVRTESNEDESLNTLDGVIQRKQQLEKSANIIKSIFKAKKVNEDLYDHEKDDKDPSRVYGKKPKLEIPNKEKSLGDEKPQAAATLRGGKTMTGQVRDTIEIDPMLRNRPGQPDVSKDKNNNE